MLNPRIKTVHITGGGFYENIPRVLPKGMGASIDSKLIPTSHVFDRLEKDHRLSKRELFSTFNMGVGFILVVSKSDVEAVMDELTKLGEEPFLVGSVDLSGKVNIT